MVKSDPNFYEGMVFLIPYNNIHILAQVGRGSDLGVFDQTYEDLNSFRREHLEGIPIFRVHFGAVSLKKFGWTPLGEYPLGKAMSESAIYYHQAVGDDRCFIVQHGVEDVEVDCDEVKQFEPLATWSHQHIVKRFEEYSEKMR